MVDRSKTFSCCSGTNYGAVTKKRMEKAIDARRRIWGADVISVSAPRSQRLIMFEGFPYVS